MSQQEAFTPEIIIQPVKHGGDSIMLWGFFTACGTGASHKMDGITRKDSKVFNFS